MQSVLRMAAASSNFTAREPLFRNNRSKGPSFQDVSIPSGIFLQGFFAFRIRVGVDRVKADHAGAVVQLHQTHADGGAATERISSTPIRMILLVEVSSTSASSSSTDLAPMTGPVFGVTLKLMIPFPPRLCTR